MAFVSMLPMSLDSASQSSSESCTMQLTWLVEVLSTHFGREYLPGINPDIAETELPRQENRIAKVRRELAE